jgi:FtsP/CotA-like multicopper oxidase with cupredoxin domain
MALWALLIAVSVALLLVWALWQWSSSGNVGAQAQAEKGAPSPHVHHAPPPTKGSELYQYSYPNRVRLAADKVFPPEAPPLAPGAKREYELVVEETNMHEVAPGINVPAWTFNGKVPGPVFRAREGEVIRVTLVNRGKLPHTIHFHGVHPAEMDGVFEMVPPGRSFTYEFVARPYGVFPYHCHSNPASQHIHNGLYGMLIVDPKEGRPPMRELAMVMSAFDLDRDGDADFYAWNGKAFQYADYPIDLQVGEQVRMYVLNIFEEMMAPHIHGNMFQLFRSGTSLKPHELTDVVSLGIAERAILEFAYEFPGAYMFQCHFSEHMELGLMGWFRVNGEKGSRAGAANGKGKSLSHGVSH